MLTAAFSWKLSQYSTIYCTHTASCLKCRVQHVHQIARQRPLWKPQISFAIDCNSIQPPSPNYRRYNLTMTRFRRWISTIVVLLVATSVVAEPPQLFEL